MNGHALKLLFVIKTLDSRGGGAERVLSDISSELVANGHQVTVLSFDRPESPDFYPLDTRIQRLRLEIGNATNKSRLIDMARRIVALRSAVNNLQPDVAIGFMHSSYIPLAIALAGSGLPVIASEHIDYSHYRTVPLENLMLRAASHLFTRITAISDKVRAGFPEALRRKMTVIPNPVAAAPAQCSDPVGGNTKTLLTVGRLFAQKDHHTLIEAFARLTGRHPKWRLRIVGEGKMRPALETQIRALGIESLVELPGVVSDISTEYRRAQLFVLPSKYESFGLATAEALSCGLPAVGFADCPGTNELISHGVNGLLADGDDRVSALVEALDVLMSSDELRKAYGAAGPASVERFSLVAIADQWDSLVRSVIREPKEQRECAA